MRIFARLYGNNGIYYFPKGIHSDTCIYNVNLLFPSDYPPMEMPSGNSLMELLDVIVLLYNLSSHDQLFKVSCLTLALCIMLFMLSVKADWIFFYHYMSIWIIVFLSVSHSIYPYLPIYMTLLFFFFYFVHFYK